MFRFIWRSLPLYGVFFLWGFGTGAQQLARPLFAASFGVSVFLVSLIQASNSLAWLVAAPTTGYLTDRFGRKPLTIAGNMLRGVTMVFQYYATNYCAILRAGVHRRDWRGDVAHRLLHHHGGHHSY